MDETLNCYFFVPGLSEKFRSGGLMVTRDIAGLLEKIPGVNVKFATTHEKYAGTLTPDEVFRKITAKAPTPDASSPTSSTCNLTLFFVTWGPLIEKHIKLIRRADSNARIIYYAQSFGWNVKIPRGIPIICVSRYVMSQWTLHAPENFCAYIPPPLQPCFCLQETARNADKRDIDILIHTRKQNEYCLKKLIPALQATNCRLQTVNEWIPQERFANLLNRTKIFLYVTAPHKAGFRRRLPGEGFGLPALEALACGALVGSNLLGGVTDFLTPGENCIKLQNGNLEFDLRQIVHALENFKVNVKAATAITEEYSSETIGKKWRNLLGLMA